MKKESILIRIARKLQQAADKLARLGKSDSGCTESLATHCARHAATLRGLTCHKGAVPLKKILQEVLDDLEDVYSDLEGDKTRYGDIHTVVYDAGEALRQEVIK